MADDMNKTTQTNPADAGQDNNNAQPADNTQQQSKVFTQEDIDRIINERLKREREKYKDYEELKKAAEELQKIKESQMTEQEKLQAKLKEYEQLLQQKELEAKKTAIESMKIKVLTELGMPVNLTSRIFGETEDEIRQDAEELKKLLGLQANTKVGTPTNPAGGNKGTRTFTKEEIARMSPEEINKNWDTIQEALKQGLIK